MRAELARRASASASETRLVLHQRAIAIVAFLASIWKVDPLELAHGCADHELVLIALAVTTRLLVAGHLLARTRLLALQSFAFEDRVHVEAERSGHHIKQVSAVVQHRKVQGCCGVFPCREPRLTHQHRCARVVERTRFKVGVKSRSVVVCHVRCIERQRAGVEHPSPLFGTITSDSDVDHGRARIDVAFCDEQPPAVVQRAIIGDRTVSQNEIGVQASIHDSTAYIL